MQYLINIFYTEYMLNWQHFKYTGLIHPFYFLKYYLEEILNHMHGSAIFLWDGVSLVLVTIGRLCLN